MDKEEWLKAINCTKEELIKWLNEMYEDEKAYRDIIRKYEDTYAVGLERVQEVYYDPKDMKEKLKYYTKIKAKNFEYKRNWE